MDKFLYCHTNVVTEFEGVQNLKIVEAIKGKKYESISRKANIYMFTIINESGDYQAFSKNIKSKLFYKKWFYLYTEEECRNEILKELLDV